MLVFNKKQRPISIQLFGNDSIELSTVAQFVEKNYAPDIIDINCGCPARKVAISKKAGSYLMKEPKKIVEIIKAIKKKTKTPLTIKIRSGWDEKHINAVEIARLAQKAGANAIIVHPRTKTQEFKGHSD
jgi:tRNA-dihydrouridine synthase